MSSTSAIDALVRRQLLEKIYSRMTDEEKQTFILLGMQNQSHQELMQTLQQQSMQISSMANKIEKQNWLTDFGSDVAANFFTDGILWLASRLFRRLS